MAAHVRQSRRTRALHRRGVAATLALSLALVSGGAGALSAYADELDSLELAAVVDDVVEEPVDEPLVEPEPDAGPPSEPGPEPASDPEPEPASDPEPVVDAEPSEQEPGEPGPDDVEHGEDKTAEPAEPAEPEPAETEPTEPEPTKSGTTLEPATSGARGSLAEDPATASEPSGEPEPSLIDLSPLAWEPTVIQNLGGFEIDGDLFPLTAAQDWSTVAYTLKTDGLRDSTLMREGASERNWPWSSDQLNGASNISTATDIDRAYVHTLMAGPAHYAYFGFIRDANNGSMVVYLEFNQVDNGTASPEREDGDLRLTVIQEGNDNPRLSAVHEWDPTGRNGRGAWVHVGASSTGFAAASNAGPIDGLSAGETIDSRIFIEVGVDLAAVYGAANLCQPAISVVNVRTASSGNNESAALQDRLEPISLTIPASCAAQLTVEKYELAHGEEDLDKAVPAGAGWTFTAGQIQHLTVQGSLERTTGTAGSVTFPLQFTDSADDGKGGVTITETQRDGWELVPQRFEGKDRNALCWTADGNPVDLGDDHNRPNGFHLAGIEMDEHYTCRIINRAPAPLVLDDADASGTYDSTRAWTWEVTKSANPSGEVFALPGSKVDVDYTIGVTATPGPWDHSNIVVSGTVTLSNPATIDQPWAGLLTVTVGGVDVTGSLTGDALVPHGKDLVLTWSRTLDELPVGDLEVVVTFDGATKSATVGWTAGSEPQTNTRATVTDAFTTADLGTPSAPFTSIYLDALEGSNDIVLPTAAADVLTRSPAADGSVAWSVDYEVVLDALEDAGTATYVNTVSITPDDDDDPTDNTVTVEITSGEPLGITAALTGQRGFSWLIEKSVVSPTTLDADRVPTQEAGPDGTATFVYEAVVRPDLAVEKWGEWALTGTVTLTNDNSFPLQVEAIDVSTDAGEATALAELPLLIGAGESVDVTVQITPTRPPAPGTEFTLDAEVTWTEHDAVDGTSAEAGEADVVWDFSLSNHIVEVHEDFAGLFDDDPVHVATVDFMTGLVSTEPAAPVVVTTPRFAEGQTTGWDGEAGSLDPERSLTLRYALTFDHPLPLLAEAHVNTVSLWDGSTKVDEDDAVVIVTAQPLEPTIGLTGSYAVDYPWTITKTADDTVRPVVPGEDAAFDYEIVVGTRRVVSEILASGEVTIHNPNAFQVPVDDIVVTLTVNGTPTVLAAPEGVTHVDGDGGTIAYPVSWSRDDGDTHPDDVVGLTVTIFGKPILDEMPDDDAVDFAAVTPQVTNGEVLVTDDFDEFGDTYDDDARTLVAEDLLTGENGESLTSGSTTFTYTARRGATAVGSDGYEDGDPEQVELCVDGSTSYTNVAAIMADDEEPLATDDAVVRVCSGEDLQVVTTIDGRLQRTYLWEITKRVVGDSVRAVTAGSVNAANPSGTATFGYEVAVTPLPLSDAGWTLSGTIEVTNPNPWDVDVTVAGLLEGLGDADCVVLDPEGTAPAAEVRRTVPAGETDELTYSCGIGSRPVSYEVTSIAVVQWDAAEAFSPGSAVRAAATLAVESWETEPVNETITVVDDKTVPGAQEVLGEVTWWDTSAEGAPQDVTFTYPLTVRGPVVADENHRAIHENVAWIDELPHLRDDAVVEAITYDLALRTWVSAVYPDTASAAADTPVMRRTAEGATDDDTALATGSWDLRRRPGPIFAVPYSTFDQDVDIHPSDILAKDILVTNQGDHDARVRQLTYYMPAGMTLAAVQEYPWQVVTGGGVAGEYGTGDSAVLTLSEADALVVRYGTDPQLLEEGEGASVRIYLQLEDEAWFEASGFAADRRSTVYATGGFSPKFEDRDLPVVRELPEKLGRDYHDLEGFAEITAFQGWVEQRAPVPEPAPGPVDVEAQAAEPQAHLMAAEPEPVSVLGGLWALVTDLFRGPTAMADEVAPVQGRWESSVLDIDSLPADRNHLLTDPGKGYFDNAMDTRFVGNELYEHCTYDLGYDDEDDHDGETVRVVRASRDAERQPLPPIREPLPLQGSPASQATLPLGLLPRTGTELVWTALTAMLLIGIGITFVTLRRRKEDTIRTR